MRKTAGGAKLHTAVKPQATKLLPQWILGVLPLTQRMPRTWWTSGNEIFDLRGYPTTILLIPEALDLWQVKVAILMRTRRESRSHNRKILVRMDYTVVAQPSSASRKLVAL
jgi:hypothetical protein